MRIHIPEAVSQSEPSGLRFRGSRGEQFAIDVLDHDMIRVRHHPDGQARLDRTWLVLGKDGAMPLEGRSRDDMSGFPLPAYAVEARAGGLVVRTGQLQVNVYLDDFRLEWLTADGQRFAADLKRRAYAYDRASQSVYHYMDRRTDEHYYGFGERAGYLDKHGARMKMLNLDALGYNAEHSDPLYKHFPFYITYIPSLKIAYGLFYDNLSTTVFDMGKEIDAFWGYYRYYMAEAGDIDYTLIFGPTIEAVIEKFTGMTGRPCLPPRWSLGYLGSTMKYTEAPDAQQQLKRFVDQCKEHDIPCDMFHLSSGYGTDAEGTRYVFTWNEQRVPDPKAMTQYFHDAGIQLAANIKPHLLENHPAYEELAASGGFVKDSESDAPAPARFWAGGAFQNGKGAYVDFTSAAGYNWWKASLKRQLLDYGVDAAWNDNNEFEIWDDDARCAGYGKEIPMAQARPLQGLQMARCSYEAISEHKPEQRPFVLTRSGTVGLQRYAQTWSGDNETSWNTLRFNIPMGLGLSLSGMPNTGHDVGGFHGPAPDPELWVRWVQNGVFHPRFCIHSWNTDGTVNEPWMYPEVLPIVRQWMEFRYDLQPYLYSLLFEAHQTGHPIIRPLVYEFPDDPRCQTESFDFLLGAHLLVASVLEPGAQTRRVYLPAGAWWCDWYTSTWYEGGQEIAVPAPLDQIPLFVRDGGIIPLMSDGRLQAQVYARNEAEFTLVEDDGISLDYQRGGYTTIRLSFTRKDRNWNAGAERTHAGYALPYEAITFVNVGDLPSEGAINVDQYRKTVKVT